MRDTTTQLVATGTGPTAPVTGGTTGGTTGGAATGAAATGSVPRVGHGLPGMRERASLAGGSFTAGQQGDEFVVTAFLPGAPAGATA